MVKKWVGLLVVSVVVVLTLSGCEPPENNQQKIRYLHKAAAIQCKNVTGPAYYDCVGSTLSRLVSALEPEVGK